MVHVNFNLVEFEDLLEYHALLDHVESSFDLAGPNFVLIDEVQMCEGFEKAVNSLHASERYDIYITGSNAFLLSSDLATLFTGRTFEVEVFPFSFAEYRRYHGEPDVDAAFDRYVLEGGMAGSYIYKTPEARYRYVAGVFDTLSRARHPPEAPRAQRVRAGARRRLHDGQRVQHHVRQKHRRRPGGGRRRRQRQDGGVVPRPPVQGVPAVQDAPVRHTGQEVPVVGRQVLPVRPFVPLREAGHAHLDYGRVYENIVAIELMRRGWEVYVGVLYKKEVDFVAMRRGEKVYIQVSDDISGEKTFERECAPLLEIRDAYPKMISRGRSTTSTTTRESIVDIARWLDGE